jgi:hypothetical protein
MKPTYELDRSSILRFVRYSRPVPSGCIEWILQPDKDGYGRIRVDGKQIPAHRLAWEWFYGRAIPAGMLICHRCDNRMCVQPAHLFLGTDKDNSDDKLRKGRQTRGSKQHLAKLSPEGARAIKLRLKAGERIVELAREYNVTPQTVGAIKSERSWVHVDI